VLTEISTRHPTVAVADVEVVGMLFRLLEGEDPQLTYKLYSALNALREAHKLQSEEVEASAAGVGAGVGAGMGVGVSAVTTTATPLRGLIEKMRCSADAKIRIAALQWARTLFSWDTETGAL
jgi:hypothetical protein